MDRPHILQHELQRVQHLGAFVASYLGKLKNVEEAFKGAFHGPAPEEFAAQAEGAFRSVHGRACTNEGFAELEASEVPAQLMEGLDIEIHAVQALALLDMLEDAVHKLQPLRAGLHYAQRAGAHWHSVVACHVSRHHNQRYGSRLLMQLPQEVLQSIVHHAGPDARLICTHLFHAYGSPGSHVILDALPAPADTLHWWPCPSAVTSLTCRDRRLSHAELATITHTFTALRRLKITQACHSYDALPPTLTSLKLTVTRAYPPEPYQLFSLCHLTALRELRLDRVPTEAPGWSPLSCLTALTALSLMDNRLQQPIGAHSADSCWKPLWALTGLRSLKLFVDQAWWQTPFPQIALPWPHLQQLSVRCIPYMVAGPQHMCRLARFVRWVVPEQADLRLEFYDYLKDNDFHLEQVLHGMRSRSLTLDCSTTPSSLHCTARMLPHLTAFALRIRHEAIRLHALVALFPPAPAPPLPLLSLSITDGYHRNPWPGDSFTPPLDLLSTLAPSIPHLTHLHLHLPNYSHPRDPHTPPAPFASASTSTPASTSAAHHDPPPPLIPAALTALTALRSLQLLGADVAASLAPALAGLPPLTALTLQCHTWDAGLVPLRGVAPWLTSLRRLCLQGGLPPPAVSDGPGSLEVVRALSRLTELDVQCEEPLGVGEARALLPVQGALRRVVVAWCRWGRERKVPRGAHQGWMEGVRRVLGGHVAELVLEERLDA